MASACVQKLPATYSDNGQRVLSVLPKQEVSYSAISILQEGFTMPY